jgi:hypothetical protein
MSEADPICRICNEPKSKHVATVLGPYTHPREATGEGRYVRKSFGHYEVGWTGEYQNWERWEFVPGHSFEPVGGSLDHSLCAHCGTEHAERFVRACTRGAPVADNTKTPGAAASPT